MSYWLIIGISGVTCGGKSTLTNKLYEVLSNPVNANILKYNVMINSVKVINQDDYFLPIDCPQHKRIEKLDHINWEIITSINIEKMCDDIETILGSDYKIYDVKRIPNGRTTTATPTNDTSTDNMLDKLIANDNAMDLHPMFNSTNGIYLNDATNRLIHLNILLIEGFLIFNHHFTLDICNIKYHLHLPYEKCFDRRQNRVYNPADVIGYFEMCVWPYYEKHFSEIKDRTDIIKLNGELPKEKIFNYVLKCIQNIL